MENTSKQRLEQLTGLRYFAALLIFVSHLKWENSSEIVKTILGSGYVGVSFFFVLSGFVLSYSYQDKILNGTITIKRYILLRFARLTPLHFATAIPFIGLAICEGNLNIFALLSNLTYLHSWVPNSSVYFSFNAPSWSLSNEIFFYICFFFLASITLTKLFKVAATVLFTVSISAVIVVTFYDGYKLSGSNTVAHWLFYIFPAFRVLEFIVGMILYRLWKKGFSISNYYVLPSYILLFLSMYFANEIPEAFRMSLYFLPVIMLFFYSHLCSAGYANRIYSSKWLVLLGNASFAFYLIHQPLINVFKNALSPLNLSDFNFFIISLVAITLLSIATYVIYEKWAEKKLKSFVSAVV